MARKLQILVEVDLDTHQVNVLAPWSHLGAVVKALGEALTIAGDTVAEQKKAALDEIARLREGKSEGGIILPNGPINA